MANAAAPEASLRFFLYAGVVVLPIIVIYTIGVYWVFRGKLREGGYDDRSNAPEVPHFRGSTDKEGGASSGIG